MLGTIEKIKMIMHRTWVKHATKIRLLFLILVSFVFLNAEITSFELLNQLFKLIFALSFGLMIIELVKNKFTFTSESRIIFVLICLIIVFAPSIISDYTSGKFTLVLIIVLLSIRFFIYDFYLFIFKKKLNIKEEQAEQLLKIEQGAILVSNTSIIFIMFLAVLYLPIKIQAYTILIMFFVFMLNDYICVKYLPSLYMKSYNCEQHVTNQFSVIYETNMHLWTIVITLYMLYSLHIFDAGQQTMYYFYSTTAQVFSALLGIVVMFGILILEKEKKSLSSDFLKNGLLGFSFLYVFVIMLSLSGLLVAKDIVLENNFNLFITYSSDYMQNFINMTIFEICFLMYPVSLFYLFALVTEFLKTDK